MGSDRAIGYEPQDWPAGFVGERLESLAAALGERYAGSLSVSLHASDSGRTFQIGAASGARRARGSQARLLARSEQRGTALIHGHVASCIACR